ncbi:MAG: hypothetical protein ACOY0T_37505 [Myxococcota bacterium]
MTPSNQHADPIQDPDTIFVKSNPEAGPVTRFGIPNRIGGSVFIGAARDPDNPKGVIYSDEIVAIPGREFRQFAREYTRAIRDGALKQVKREDWEAEETQRKAKLNEERNRIEAERASRETAAASSSEPTAPGGPAAPNQGQPPES